MITATPATVAAAAAAKAAEKKGRETQLRRARLADGEGNHALAALLRKGVSVR